MGGIAVGLVSAEGWRGGVEGRGMDGRMGAGRGVDGGRVEGRGAGLWKGKATVFA